MMAKWGPRAIKEFTLSAYSQFEMRVVILTSYMDEDQGPSVALWV